MAATTTKRKAKKENVLGSVTRSSQDFLQISQCAYTTRTWRLPDGTAQYEMLDVGGAVNAQVLHRFVQDNPFPTSRVEFSNSILDAVVCDVCDVCQGVPKEQKEGRAEQLKALYNPAGNSPRDARQDATFAQLATDYLSRLVAEGAPALKVRKESFSCKRGDVLDRCAGSSWRRARGGAGNKRGVDTGCGCIMSHR